MTTIKPIVTLPTEVNRHIDLGFTLFVEKLTVRYLASLHLPHSAHSAIGDSATDAIANLEIALIEREAEQERDGMEEAEIERARTEGRY